MPVASNALGRLYTQSREAHCHFLTPLEGEVLSLMYQGLDNSEIATRIACSHATVRRHVGDIAHKVFDTTRVPPKRERLVAWFPLLHTRRAGTDQKRAQIGIGRSARLGSAG
jgi:DNA-binding CsgD family transcriptional regulator